MSKIEKKIYKAKKRKKENHGEKKNVGEECILINAGTVMKNEHTKKWKISKNVGNEENALKIAYISFRLIEVFFSFSFSLSLQLIYSYTWKYKYQLWNNYKVLRYSTYCLQMIFYLLMKTRVRKECSKRSNSLLFALSLESSPLAQGSYHSRS